LAGEHLRRGGGLGEVEDAGDLVGRQIVDLEQVPHDPSTFRRMATPSSISSSVMSNGGARRNAVGVTALTTRPASRAALATTLASTPSASSAAMRSPSPRTAAMPSTS